MLTLDGKPVEIFYSASCGGRSESAADVWPGGTRFPYLRSVPDDVHEDEVPWMLTLTLEEIRQALVKAGFGGDRLRDIDIEERTHSGRVARLKLSGLRPDAIAGDPFRMAIGPRQLRSTAFSMTRDGNSVRFTGVGYGHGVGMCVIGSGARDGGIARGDPRAAFPGLTLMAIGSSAPVEPPSPVSWRRHVRRSLPTPATPINVRVPNGSSITAGDLGRLALRMRESLSSTLRASADGVTVELHGTIDGFRYETGRPWWVSGSERHDHRSGSGTVAGTAGRSRADAARAMAELLMAPSLADRPAWVRVGARAITRDLPRRLLPRAMSSARPTPS